jgi:hypothetical protein
MRLDSDMVERALDQFEAKALPNDNPVVPKLNEMFGDHTFFVNNDGRHIIEPAEADHLIGDVLATADRSGLRPQEPDATDITVDLSPGPSKPFA